MDYTSSQSRRDAFRPQLGDSVAGFQLHHPRLTVTQPHPSPPLTQSKRRSHRSTARQAPHYNLKTAWSPLNAYLTDSEPEEGVVGGEVSTLNVASIEKRASAHAQSAGLAYLARQGKPAKLSTSQWVQPLDYANPKQPGQRYFLSDTSSDDEYRNSSSASEARAPLKKNSRKRKAMRTRRITATKKKKGTPHSSKLTKENVAALVQFMTEGTNWYAAAHVLNGNATHESVKPPLVQAKRAALSADTLKNIWEKELSIRLIADYGE